MIENDDEELRARVEEAIAQMNANPALMAKLRSNPEVREALDAVIESGTRIMAMLDDPDFDWGDSWE